jgi:hypothetical protein
MVENPGRDREEAAPEQAEGGSGLRAVSEAVAVVAAGALVGGGIGMLGGVALGAINPFALGIVGAVVGAGLPVLRGAFGARGAARRPWWRRVFGG